MPRRHVLLAGLFHETHTFLDGTTGLADFQVRRGNELLAAAGDGSPLAGAVEAAGLFGWRLLPAVDYRATPGPTVRDEVYQQFQHELLRSVREADAPLDGVLLILHGAMVCESVRDVEGELLSALRAALAPLPPPVVGVLDLHASFSAAMAESADALVAYRHNPHTDAHETALRAAQVLEHLMSAAHRPRTLRVPLSIMWPPTGTATADEPMRTLESLARKMESDHPDVLAANVVAGFSFADTPDTGACLSVVTRRESAALQEDLRAAVRWSHQNWQLGCPRDLSVQEALSRVAASPPGLVVLAEPADNIGGGAPGDCTGLLRALVEGRLERAAVCLADPLAVAALAGAQPGDVRRLPLGGRGSSLDPGPLTLDVELVSSGDGKFMLEDIHSHLASMCGDRFDMGRCAVVRHAGVTILLTSQRTPPFDLGQWRSQGIEPASMRVIGVKAAVAHRQAYNPIATASYSVDTPGPCPSDLTRLPYRFVQRPILPLDPDHAEQLLS